MDNETIGRRRERKSISGRRSPSVIACLMGLDIPPPEQQPHKVDKVFRELSKENCNYWFRGEKLLLAIC